MRDCSYRCYLNEIKIVLEKIFVRSFQINFISLLVWIILNRRKIDWKYSFLFEYSLPESIPVIDVMDGIDIGGDDEFSIAWTKAGSVFDK